MTGTIEKEKEKRNLPQNAKKRGKDMQMIGDILLDLEGKEWNPNLKS